MSATDKGSLARFGFEVGAKFNGVDPESSHGEASWGRREIRAAWDHLATAMEAEVLRRHGIMPMSASAELVKPLDILKLNAEMSGR